MIIALKRAATVIEVLLSGISSSIQDSGRFGYRHLGVPVSGAMDLTAFHLANALVNNTGNCACIEMAYSGPRLRFHQNTYIALTGAHYPFKINNKPVATNQVISIEAGDILSCGHCTSGIYAYLAVHGGIKSEKSLESRSEYVTITGQKKLRKGQNIPYDKSKFTIVNRAKTHTYIDPLNRHLIAVSKGPEYNFISEKNKVILFKKQFMLDSKSNRMAYQIKPLNGMAATEIISSSVQPGTVQLTPSGEILILMRDCQTTGGYARILQLSHSSINRICQLKAGQKFVFFQRP